MKMQFYPINLQKWPRSQMFFYFSEMAPTGYSITVSMDITIMRKELKKKKKKFFPSYLYLVTKALNKQEEFKIAEKDGILGVWNTLTPMYAAFHEDDKTFSLMWTEYDEDFQVFYHRYNENLNRYGNNHGILAQSDRTPPDNCYTISCIPWVEFQHFAVHCYENKKYFFPSVEAGKFYKENNLLRLPLSITLHHATTDGYHVKCFVEDLQNEMNHPENWIQ